MNIRASKYFIDTWYHNGKKHRLDGPAKIQYNINGDKITEYYQIYGRLHRENGPAIITYTDNKVTMEEYFIDGERYREDGRVIITYKNDTIKKEHYYIDGNFVSETYFNFRNLFMNYFKILTMQN